MIELYPNSALKNRELMNSLKDEGLKPVRLTFGRAPFFAVIKSSADMINALSTKEWLYYPNELGKALAKEGISTFINCHSGREMINGEYIN